MRRPTVLITLLEHPVIKPIVILILGVLVFSTTINAQTSPQGPTRQTQIVSPQPENISEEEYPFHPGDGVLVSVFPDTASFLNRIFPIDDTGHILMPIVGKVNVSKMTEQELVDFILKNFNEYLKYPYVQVRPLIRVSVLGGVRRPGFYYIDPNRSLWELIYETGGPVREDGLKKMKWERNREFVSKDLIPYLQSGQSLAHMGLKSGDQIWTPSQRARTWVDIFRDLMIVASFFMTFYVIYRDYRRDELRYGRYYY